MSCGTSIHGWGLLLLHRENLIIGEMVNRRKPGALHHLAFKAASRVEVDRLHSELKRIGATIVSPPREYPEYTPPGYYALFFKDLEGIKYEIVCTEHNAT